MKNVVEEKLILLNLDFAKRVGSPRMHRVGDYPPSGGEGGDCFVIAFSVLCGYGRALCKCEIATMSGKNAKEKFTFQIFLFFWCFFCGVWGKFTKLWCLVGEK